MTAGDSNATDGTAGEASVVSVGPDRNGETGPGGRTDRNGETEANEAHCSRR